MNFLQYIGSLRHLFKVQDCTKFVLGNSGADYDSVIGSLIYAFYMTISMKVLYLPLIDCKEQDLALRFQVTSVLNTLLIQQSDLIYTDMINNLYSKNNTFVLYDHNVRSNLQADQIEEIVDHHAYDPQKIKCNHIINHCGSALTLLYYLYYPELLKNFQGTQLHKKFELYFLKHKPLNRTQLKQSLQTIDHLLYYGILIDTYGLNQNQAQVWNQFDKLSVTQLQKQITPKYTFDQLGQVKFNVQKNLNLTFKQQQIKDYKKINYGNFDIHFSTILLDVDIFLQRYQNQMEKQLDKNCIYAFMFSFPSGGKQDIKDGNFKKFIVYTSTNQDLLAKLDKILGELYFNRFEDVRKWRKWTDPTGKISRKVLDKQIKARL